MELAIANDIPNPTKIINSKGSEYENPKWKAAKAIDPSHCTVIAKIGRASSSKVATSNTKYLLFKNDSIEIHIDSASIINDLKDELLCEEDSASKYSRSIRRIIENLLKNKAAIHQTAMDSVVVLNSIASMHLQGKLILDSVERSKINTSIDCWPGDPEIYVEAVILSIAGMARPHFRKMTIRFSQNDF